MTAEIDTEEYCCFYRRKEFAATDEMPDWCIIYQSNPVEVVALLFSVCYLLLSRHS